MPNTVAADGTRLYYVDAGRPDREPVLLVQGLGVDHRGWILQRPRFQRRYRCLLPDNRGVGRSDRPSGPYDLEVMAADLVAVLDHAGIDSAHVVGASMGGVLAQILAVRHPERVRSLTLACTACRHLPWRVELLEEWAETAQHRGMRVFLEQNIRWVVGPRSIRRFWLGLGVLSPLVIGAATDPFVAQVRAILAMDDGLRRELCGIDVPTLVVVGSQDTLTPLGDAIELAELIPGARLAVVSGGAHGFMVEQAPAFNRVVTSFLDEVISGRREAAERSPAAAAPLCSTADPQPR
jgi:3-oxoadipate enol-lactonase